jgi:hypothetical protein
VEGLDGAHHGEALGLLLRLLRSGLRRRLGQRLRQRTLLLLRLLGEIFGADDAS